MVKWNGPFRSDRSNREKRSTSKGAPLFSKLFWLDLTDPFSFRPKFPEILVEWIAVFCGEFFRGMPVAGHGKFSDEFLLHRRRKTANLIDS